jgi:hypothetical protein
LWYAVILGVQDSPSHRVAGGSKTNQLIAEEWLILRETHAIDVFDDEGEGSDLPERAVKVAVEIVNAVIATTATALAVTLAGVATCENVSSPKFVD